MHRKLALALLLLSAAPAHAQFPWGQIVPLDQEVSSWAAQPQPLAPPEDVPDTVAATPAPHVAKPAPPKPKARKPVGPPAAACVAEAEQTCATQIADTGCNPASGLTTCRMRVEACVAAAVKACPRS